MSDKSKPESFAEEARAAFKKLQAAINAPPIEELVAPFKEDLGLRRNSDRQHLRDAIEDLVTRAAIAHPDALRELVYLNDYIRGVLQEFNLPPPPHLDKPCQGKVEVSHAEPAARTAASDWRNDLNESVERLIDLAGASGGALEQELDDVVGRLAPAPLSFPLRILKDYIPPAERPTHLVAEICDRLVEQRLAAERRRVFESPPQNGDKRFYFPPGWVAKERAPNSPLEIVRQIYMDLEGQRIGHHSAAELEELKAWGTLIDDSVPRMLALRNTWVSQAVRLPQLDASSSTIGKWVEVALLLVAARYDGSLKSVSWNKLINQRIKKTGSLESGLKLFLREGFETLAGKDRKTPASQPEG